jgi:hypothetical protein
MKSFSTSRATTPKDILDRSEWILLALNAAEKKRLSPVQLQKILFLLGDRRPESVGSNFYAFRPYHYGPFDADVYHDADALAARKLVLLDEAKGRTWRAYVLTRIGQKNAELLEQRAPRKTVLYLRKLVEWAEPLPFESLVRAIYDAYPKMRANSIFRVPSNGQE